MVTESIAAAIQAQQSGEVSARELLASSLEAVDQLDEVLHCIVTVDEAGASKAAAAADAALESGRLLGALHGIPVAVKDIIDMRSLATRCGSAAYSDEPKTADAPVVRRLRNFGAVVFAKTTAHELACGVYSPPASNPWDPQRIPGGSSGGSGAAVAAGVTMMALGSDTGGSIRIPAALCGVAGMKPTYGLVPTSGVAALSWSLDHIGPLARTVADCAVTLDAIAGPEPTDPTSLTVDRPSFAAQLDQPIRDLRIGVIRNHFNEPIQAGVAAAFDTALDVLTELGAYLIDIEIPELDITMAAEFGIIGPEAAAYHRRLLEESPELIDPGIRALLVSGRVLPAEQYFRAMQAREHLRRSVSSCFSDNSLDAVVTPQLPATAALKDQTEFEYQSGPEDVTAAYVRTTAPFNLTGQPALSVPSGFDGLGLPIGLQIAGRPLGDATVLRIGAAYESETDWHRQRPALHSEAG